VTAQPLVFRGILKSFDEFSAPNHFLIVAAVNRGKTSHVVEIGGQKSL
jgi:hypothetical protein